ncbi:hypothetical protein F0562_002556 [Nyssa sinensis]|uniref:Uncharacterized protein n=1 Tax=Nyssa sinensis TaxID=561372 RepID=A0A5J5C9V0_9ASTE|nr:hypothetical protein F0562_002556 [Nyssa sinensis]
MAVSVESSSPDSLRKETRSFMTSSPMFSPSSDKRFWSALRSRIDTLLDNRKPAGHMVSNSRESNHTKRMKEDALLLLRGFDSVAYSLSQLSNNLDNAVQRARDLARPPTLTEIFHSTMEMTKSQEEASEEAGGGEEMKKARED